MRNISLQSLRLLLFAFFASPLLAQVPASVVCPTGMTAGGPKGTFTATLTGAAPAGLTATPDSSNTAVATVPAPFTIPTGATTFTFQVTPVAAGNADAGVTVNGTRLDCRLTVGAAVAPPAPATGATLSTTGLILLAGLLGVTGLIVVRRA